MLTPLVLLRTSDMVLPLRLSARRYEKNLANLIQMASCVFAVNAASLGDGTSSDMAVVRAATRDGRRSKFTLYTFR